MRRRISGWIQDFSALMLRNKEKVLLDMDLIQQIDRHLGIVKDANDWARTYLEGEKSRRAHNNIIDIRRRLKKKRFALEGNPAAALYGESQVGKSYLIGSLLSEPGKPFGLTDENGVFHNFVDEINPIGGGSESTSLVSRFSVNYSPKNLKYPVKGVLLTPADLIMALCDSFYSDVKADRENRISKETINDSVAAILSTYTTHTVVQTHLTEDDVLDISDYFNDRIAQADAVLDSTFFREIPRVIESIAPDVWPDVFSLLWNKNKDFTDIFSQLINAYKQLCFAPEVYLPVESVLNRCGTLLDVVRLREIFSATENVSQNYTPTTVVLLPSGAEIQIAKSFLCALTAELVFGQPKSLAEKKPFLRQIDLLDFPGARARMEVRENLIESKNMPDFLLRGKVAYLFNRYSASEKINILLFCAKHTQSSQRTMPALLNNWIVNILGKTPEDRQNFIKNSKVSPLFIIGTFFNVNLAYDSQQDKKGDDTSLKYRWNQRFEKTLANELINVENYNWFDNWTLDQRAFRNIYLLRDFAKSEDKSHLYEGFAEYKKEVSEIPVPGYPDFRDDLKKSFVEYPFVKQHFENPSYSWDEAATINKDGTELIISKLSVVAENISQARSKKLIRELIEIKEDFLQVLRKYYHSNDKDAELQSAKSVAGNVQLCLDGAFSADGIRDFGSLMRELMIKESEVLKLFRSIVTDINHSDLVNRDKYSTFRINVPVVAGDTIETYFARLCAHYEKVGDGQIEAFRQELEARHIDLKELIAGASNLVKNNSQQLSEALLAFWLESLYSDEKKCIKAILASDGCTALQDIKDMYEKLFKKYNVEKRLADSISEYVDGKAKNELPYEIISDVCSEELNNCIRTVGFAYLDNAEIKDLEMANEKNNLGLKIETNNEEPDQSVEEVFTRIDRWADIISSDPYQMKSLSNYRNYLSWYNRLKIGFVIVCEIPNYDVAANEILGQTITECNNIQY